MNKKRILVLLIPLAMGAFALVRYAVVLDRSKFERESVEMCQHPEQFVGKSTGLDTFDSWGVSSRYLASQVDEIVEECARLHEVPGQTYFSESGDMPTQETIWQFADCFLRVYATSALDRDGVEIGVYEGSYQDFRGDRLSDRVAPEMRFASAEYRSPNRFFDMDR